VKTKQLQAVDCKTAWQPTQQSKNTSLEAAAADACEEVSISWTESLQLTSVPFNLASESVNISCHQLTAKQSDR
jgi:hypothetical protein